jgi:hypothetical protein
MSSSCTRPSAGITQIRSLRVGGAFVRPLSPVGPSSPTLRGILAPEDFVAELAAARIGETFNQYADGPRARLLRARLGDYLSARSRAGVLLVGEAAGYSGARVSGLPFTSERQLTGEGPAEATATIMQRALARLGLADEVLLWNVVPTHPGTESSNRPPRSCEVTAGLRFVATLSSGRVVVAIGRVAERALGAPFVPHPSHGRAQAFEARLLEFRDRGLLVPGSP